ncbi:MAG TPA: hypothetical protein VML55_20535, partial [Planctomycetaceae bacterium]|nr:hypothetical protein [Planctomycetaceae bacterium]
MSASSFRCPHCATTLRVRDRKFIGRQIACPDCRQPIEIVADGPRGLGGKPVAVAEAPPRKTWRERAAGLWPGRRASTAAAAGSSAAVLGAPDGAGAAVPRGAPGRLARAAAVLASPVGVAWTLAGVVTLGMVVLIWPTDGATSRPGTGPAGGEAGTARATPTQPQNDSRPGPAGNPGPVGVEDQIGDRLTRLGERLDAY